MDCTDAKRYVPTAWASFTGHTETVKIVEDVAACIITAIGLPLVMAYASAVYIITSTKKTLALDSLSVCLSVCLFCLFVVWVTEKVVNR